MSNKEKDELAAKITAKFWMDSSTGILMQIGSIIRAFVREHGNADFTVVFQAEIHEGKEEE